MLIAFHVRAGIFALTSVALKLYIIPQPSSFTIPPIAVTAIIDIGKGKADHKITILQHTRLRVLDKPNSGVVVINDLFATDH